MEVKKKPVRFLYFIEGVNFGGQQSFFYNVFKNFDKQKIELHTVYINEKTEMYDNYNEISKSIERIDKRPIGFNKNLMSLFKLIGLVRLLASIAKRKKIDVIGCNGFYTFIISVFVSRFYGIKVVRFIGGDLRKQEGSYFGSRLFNFLYRIPKKYFGYFFINKLMVEKLGAKKSISEQFSLMKAVDHELFSPKKDTALRKKIGIADDEFVIGWIGRLTAQMEIEETFEVFEALLRKNQKKIKLLIVGDGVLKQKLQSIASKGNYVHLVHFIGVVPYEKVPYYISVMDVVPLIHYDPHGGSIVREAMSCGKVALTVDGESHTQTEFINHKVDGILVPTKNRIHEASNAISWLIENKDERLRIGANARKRVVEEFSFMNLTRIVERELKDV